jgi:YegS/Rv2252/BmrU family lipid kinase
LNVSLVVNPIAGNKAHKSINRIEELLKSRATLNSLVTRKKGDAFNFAKNLSNTDRIVVASGDGTLNEVINGICNSGDTGLRDVPIALIPLGTTNVLAKDRCIPEQIEKAVDLALNGTPRKISLGRINGRYFVIMAGIGIDGEAVLGVRENILKKISGKAEHIVSGIKSLVRYDPPLITVKTDDGVFTGYTAVIGNARSYAGYFHVTPEASITEPVLDICMFRSKTRKDIIRFVGGVIMKRHLRYKDVLYGKYKEMEVASSGTVHVQIDGDYFGTLPVKIDSIESAVTLVW